MSFLLLFGFDESSTAYGTGVGGRLIFWEEREARDGRHDMTWPRTTVHRSRIPMEDGIYPDGEGIEIPALSERELGLLFILIHLGRRLHLVTCIGDGETMQHDTKLLPINPWTADWNSSTGCRHVLPPVAVGVGHSELDVSEIMSSNRSAVFGPASARPLGGLSPASFTTNSTPSTTASTIAGY